MLGDHSSLLCSVITEVLQSSINHYGRIDWEEVSSIINNRLADSNSNADDVTYTGVDCHKHWRYLAYGELNKTVDIATEQDSFDYGDDSDEVSSLFSQSIFLLELFALRSFPQIAEN